MQVGEIRPATVEDFKQLLGIVFSHDGWEAKPNKGGVNVWTKAIPSSPVKMIKLAVDFDDISAVTLYDVLHDPYFRKVWDDSMIEGLDIYKIDDYNDIGYYSLRCPPPLKNRDFVNQRSWGIFGEDHLIMNHTIDIEEMPVKKDFVRGVSYLTGYVVRKKGAGCSVYYITQNDPGGQVPKWILNRISSVIAPKVLEKIHKAALTYEQWKSENNPDWRPWRGIGQDDKPTWPRLSNTFRSSNSTPSLDFRKSEPTSPVLANGLVDTDRLQYGSLDSLAQHRSETPKLALHTSPDEIIGNIFNVPISSTPEDSKPPLVRHESITLRYADRSETPDNVLATSDNMSYNTELRNARLYHTNSVEYTTYAAPTEQSMKRMGSNERGVVRRTDSLDTAGSEISDLCHSIAQLTKGDQSTRHNKTESATSLPRHGTFASVSVAAHPIDPDCCTRVSRHALDVYGVSTPSPSRLSPSSGTHRTRYPAKTQVDTIPEKAEYRSRKSSREPEGLESSSLKFFSKMSKSKSRDQRHHRKKRLVSAKEKLSSQREEASS